MLINLNYYFLIGFLILLISFLCFFFFTIFILLDYRIFIEWNFITINSFNVIYLVLFDWIRILFIFVVLFISSIVIFYSSNYMGINRYSSNRFLFLVVIFVFRILFIIIRPNLFRIILGWDGLGLVSYCLVIYYNSIKSYLAGMVTCLINRLGDIGLLICISWLFSYGRFNFIFYSDIVVNNVIYLLILSSFTKRAQIPFRIWLPAAIAAPTPVSSLVHSSTLVTAGVYLLIRFFNYFYYYNLYFLFISVITIFIASFCANYEFDLRKIIALSTLRQLGLIMRSLFIGLVNLSFFHLLTHAIFKSLLFLCSGIFIFYINDNQDIRYIGSVCQLLPFCTCCFNIARIALCGIPFLSGFYSKDLIVEIILINNSVNLFILFMFYFCLGLTACYSLRLLYYSIIVNYNSIIIVLFFENLNFIKFSIYLLTIFSVFFGCLILWLLLFNFKLIVFPLFIKLLTLICVFFGFLLGLYLINIKINLRMINYYLFCNIWFIFSYSYYLYSLVYNFSNKYSIDLCWGEFFGSLGLSYYLINLINFIQFYILNNLRIIFFTFLIWLLILL